MASGPGSSHDDFLSLDSLHLCLQCEQNSLTFDSCASQEISFRLDLLKHIIISSLYDPRDAEHPTPTPQFKNIDALSIILA